MKLDLHLHSMHSRDALTRPETICRKMKELRAGFALTDHDTIIGWKEAGKHAKKLGVPFIQGKEMHVKLNGKFLGELIVLFMQEDIKATDFHEVVDAAKKQGALASIPHPFDLARKTWCRCPGEAAKRVDFIEVFNSRTHWQGFNKKAELLAAQYGLPKTAGSDAHTPREIGNCFIEVEANNLEEARKKLLKNDSQVKGKWGGVFPHVYTQLAKYGLAGPR